MPAYKLIVEMSSTSWTARTRWFIVSATFLYWERRACGKVVFPRGRPGFVFYFFQFAVYNGEAFETEYLHVANDFDGKSCVLLFISVIKNERNSVGMSAKGKISLLLLL